MKPNQNSQGRPMALPTERQVETLARMTGIKAKGRLARYAARKIGKPVEGAKAPALSRYDWSRAISAEMQERYGSR
jgi:hypothetical protein